MGLGIAFAATRSLIAFVGRGNSYVAMNASPDLGVLLFTLGVSLLTGLLFGLAPSIHAARIGSGGALSAGARTVQSSVRTSRARSSSFSNASRSSACARGTSSPSERADRTTGDITSVHAVARPRDLKYQTNGGARISEELISDVIMHAD